MKTKKYARNQLLERQLYIELVQVVVVTNQMY